MHRQLARRQNGVTLVELIFTVAIAATLMSISLPALGNLLDSAKSRGARGLLTASLGVARSNAASRHRDVVVCPSSDHAQCDDSIWWQRGWIVYEDANRNRKRDAGETLIEVVDAQPGAAIASSAGRKYIAYREDGSATGTNLTYTICDRRGATQATTLVVNNAGRVRQGTPTAAQSAAACAGL